MDVKVPQFLYIRFQLILRIPGMIEFIDVHGNRPHREDDMKINAPDKEGTEQDEEINEDRNYLNKETAAAGDKRFHVNICNRIADAVAGRIVHGFHGRQQVAVKIIRDNRFNFLSGKNLRNPRKKTFLVRKEVADFLLRGFIGGDVKDNAVAVSLHFIHVQIGNFVRAVQDVGKEFLCFGIAVCIPVACKVFVHPVAVNHLCGKRSRSLGKA